MREAQELKILISTTIFPNRADITRCVFEKKLADEMQDQCQLNVTVPVPYVPPFLAPEGYSAYRSLPKKDSLDGLEISHPRYFVIPKFFRSLHAFFWFGSLFPHYRKIFKTNKPDAILGIWAYPDGLTNLLLAKAHSIPIVIACRGSDINRLIKLPIHRKLIAWTLKRANYILSVSEALKTEIVKLGVPAENVIVIPNGVETEKFKPISQALARKQLNLNTSDKIIVTVSRLSYEKGVDVLINAIAKLSDHSVTLALVGDGAERATLEALVKTLGVEDRVKFYGSIPNHEIPLWLNAADVFALGSRTEGWPNVLMEALSCGTPIVSTNVGGIPEIINSPELGILVPPENPSEMAKSLQTALDRTWDPQQLRDRVSNRSWHNVAEETCQLLGLAAKQSTRRVIEQHSST